MTRNRQRLLGHGVYSFSEAAHYTRLHHSRVRSWFVKKSGRNRKPLFQFDYSPVDHSYAVSFLDLIDVLVVGRLREKGVLMGEIRAAHAVLRHRLGTSHPFCHESILTDGRRIFIDTANEMGSESLSEVVTGQGIFENVIRPYLEKLEYEESLARRWSIAPGVVIDPATNFGKPSLDSTGIATYILWKSFLANGDDADFVAEMYDIHGDDVVSAVEFEQAYGIAA